MKIVKKLIRSVDSLTIVKSDIKDIIVKEKNILDEKERIAEIVDKKLKEMLDIDYESAVILSRSDKVLYSCCGEYSVSVSIKNDYEFNISLLTRKYRDGKAPWVKRRVNSEEFERFMSFTEDGNRIVAITDDQESAMDSYLMRYQRHGHEVKASLGMGMIGLRHE